MSSAEIADTPSAPGARGRSRGRGILQVGDTVGPRRARTVPAGRSRRRYRTRRPPAREDGPPRHLRRAQARLSAPGARGRSPDLDRDPGPVGVGPRRARTVPTSACSRFTAKDRPPARVDGPKAKAGSTLWPSSAPGARGRSRTEPSSPRRSGGPSRLPKGQIGPRREDDPVAAGLREPGG